MLFKMTIGDWSHDGHGQTKEYTVSTPMNLNDVREAHFLIEEKTGLSIHSIVNKYECQSISPEEMYKLLQIEGFKENFEGDLISGGYGEDKINLLKKFLDEDPETEDMYEDEFEFYPTPRFMVDLWISLLNKVNPNLQLQMVDSPKIPTLHFYGQDESGRHISQVGYGLFD